MGKVLGSLAGAAFFVWLAGIRPLDPGEIGWLLMRYDWPVHFLGWHFFRSEPWHWPPGLITSFYAPMGTAIGFTDSIPLVAFALKPFSSWLPATFQYIGPWLFLCFVLQGGFGAWLVSLWTPRISLQAISAAFFVVMPVLLVRIGHPSLCAQWLVLWAFAIVARDAAAPVPRWEWFAVVAIAALVHPYLAVMVFALLSASVWRSSQRRMRELVPLLAIIVAAWWASGMFSVTGVDSLVTSGLGHYSVNLLGPIIQAGWSQFLPDIPRATPGQNFEGFQYLGLGALGVLLVAVIVALRARGRARPAAAPRFGKYIWLAAGAMAVFAVSQKITFADHVLVDLTGPWIVPFAAFRASGRFFWPLSYLALTAAIATIVARLPPRPAIAILLPLLIVQLVDLHGAHELRRQLAHDPAFYEWPTPMPSEVWHRILPFYQHLVLYPPPQCGPEQSGYEAAAYLAGLHGLTINAGGVARPDEAARLRYCHDLGDQMKVGQLLDDTVYIVAASEVNAIRAAATGSAVCGEIDRVSVCVTRTSYQRVADLVSFE